MEYVFIDVYIQIVEKLKLKNVEKLKNLKISPNN